MKSLCPIDRVCGFAVQAWASSGPWFAERLKRGLPTLLSALALLALSDCALRPVSTAPPGDSQLSRTSNLARVAFDRGSTAQAASLYEMALKRARAMDDAVEIGNAAYNLALCRVILGELDLAEASLAEARVAFERGGSIPADVLMLEATVAQRQGRPEQSLVLADQVLSTSPDESHRFQAWLLKGVIACEHSDTTRARAALAEAEKIRLTNPVLLAAKEGLTGSILLLEENPIGAAAAFDRAAARFQEARRYRAMALALRRAGEAYREAGDMARAENRLLRARRSLVAQGEKAE